MLETIDYCIRCNHEPCSCADGACRCTCDQRDCDDVDGWRCRGECGCEFCALWAEWESKHGIA